MRTPILNLQGEKFAVKINFRSISIPRYTSAGRTRAIAQVMNNGKMTDRPPARTKILEPTDEKQGIKFAWPYGLLDMDAVSSALSMALAMGGNMSTSFLTYTPRYHAQSREGARRGPERLKRA